MVTIKNLFIYIHNQKILNNIQCSLLPKRITIFIGKSGAGKTTLLKSLAGLIPITEGTITINNKELKKFNATQRCKKVGYVFQDFNLFGNCTVLQNCMDPLIVHGIALDQARQQALNVLEELEMTEYINQYPSELSGGQQQRVAIARALCLKPEVLLLDEPTASLDPINTANLIVILKRLASQGLTIGISSHDMDLVRALFDRVYYIESGTIIEYCEDLSMISSSSALQKFITQH